MAFVLVQVEVCRACAGWGWLRADQLCFPCWNWDQRKRRTRGRCLRCGTELVLNHGGMCRLCVIEVRRNDEEWQDAFFDHRPLPARGLQLSLVLDNIRLAAAQPVAMQRNARNERKYRLRNDARPCDDPRVLRIEITGQTCLLRADRTLTLEHASRIRDRPTPELPAVIDLIARWRAERAQSNSWAYHARTAVHLALAARDPDDVLVREEDLHQLPRDARLASDILRALDLLRPCQHTPPAVAPPPPAPRPRPRRVRPRPQRGSRRQINCVQCLAWLGDKRSGTLCVPCQAWGRSRGASHRCDRCRAELPLDKGLCRRCHIILTEPSWGHSDADQLWIGGPGQPRTPSHLLSLQRYRDRVGGQSMQARSPGTPVHLTDPRQTELVPAPARDWSVVDVDALPKLTEKARLLVEEFTELARAQAWTQLTRWGNTRVLTILLAWLGANAPIPETEVQAVARLHPNHAGLRVTQFLASRDLLIPEGRIGMDEAAVSRLTGTVPLVFRPDVETWIRVLRGKGSRKSHQIPWTTVRRYLGYVLPILTSWDTAGIGGFREITSEDITKALQERPFPSDRSAHSGLRSLFRALRRERRIFHNPARSVALPAVERLPRPLPNDRISGLLDRAPTPMCAAAIGLIAVHGVRPTQILHLQLADLDRSRGKLLIRRPGNTRSAPSEHTVYLDELTLALLTSWLADRHRQWPSSSNPHLFVSRRTAMNTDHPPITKLCLHIPVRKLGVTPGQLWTDRILDEAKESADPIHLVRLFGITHMTALKYVRAAHPERFMIDPAQA